MIACLWLLRKARNSPVSGYSKKDFEPSASTFVINDDSRTSSSVLSASSPAARWKGWNLPNFRDWKMRKFCFFPYTERSTNSSEFRPLFTFNVDSSVPSSLSSRWSTYWHSLSTNIFVWTKCRKTTSGKTMWWLNFSGVVASNFITFSMEKVRSKSRSNWKKINFK